MSSTGPILRQTIEIPSRKAMQWFLCGAVCGFGLTVFALALTIAVGFALFALGIVRRRADPLGLFTLGFGSGFAVYMVLAIWVAVIS